MANQIDEWIQKRVGPEAASAHRSELKRVKHELRYEREVLVDVVPVRLGRIGAQLLIITNERLFTVSKSVNVPLGAVSGIVVGEDNDDPSQFSLLIAIPDKQIPLRVHGSYRELLLASLHEVAPLDRSTPERARAFQERQSQAKAEKKKQKQEQVDDDARTSAYVALGASVVAYFFWEFHWVPLVAAALTAFAWFPEEQGKRRSTAGLGALVAASVVSAINLFLVGVDRGLIQ